MKTIGRAYCFQTLFQFCVFSSQNGRSASFLAVDALVVVVAVALAFALVDAIVVAMLAIVVVIVVVIGGAVVLHRSQNSGSPLEGG